MSTHPRGTNGSTCGTAMVLRDPPSGEVAVKDAEVVAAEPARL